MIEVQALVSSAVYGTPQRSATGFNSKRLNMILAILEKRAGIQIGSKDVFLNITGGINIADPSIDLAVISSIISSHENIPIDRNTCFAGEIGLSGELRGISKLSQRLSEAKKLGFNLLYIFISDEPEWAEGRFKYLPNKIILKNNFLKKKKFTRFAKSKLSTTKDGKIEVRILKGQESFRIKSFVKSNIWALLPAGKSKFKKGEIIDCFFPNHPNQSLI